MPFEVTGAEAFDGASSLATSIGKYQHGLIFVYKLCCIVCTQDAT